MSMLAKENEKVMLLMVKVMEQGEEPKKRKRGKKKRILQFLSIGRSNRWIILDF